MLFKLQAIQGRLNPNETAEQKEEFEKVSSQFPCTLLSVSMCCLRSFMAQFSSQLQNNTASRFHPDCIKIQIAVP